MECVDTWECPTCDTPGNDGRCCRECGTKLLSFYDDIHAEEDGTLVDLGKVWPGPLLPMAPNGLVVNRCTNAVLHAFAQEYEEGGAEAGRLWKAITASMEREDDGRFKGSFEGNDLGLVPNAVEGMTLMFPSDS